MDVKKSLNIALAKKGINKTEFADELGVSRARLYALVDQNRFHKDTLEKISLALGMKVSEFIALGE